MGYPERDKYSHWSNQEPITDVHEVLHFLAEQSRIANEEFHLHRTSGEEWEWELVAPWYTHGSSGGDRSGWDYYQIDPALAEQLVQDGLVTPHRIPRMGYMETRENELVLSSEGRMKVIAFDKEMRIVGEGLLTPGIHTDLTGTPDYRGYRREEFRHGKLYYQFEMPTGGICRVYPEEGKVLLPEEVAALAT